MTDYNGHTTNYSYTARDELARMTYITFTSPGAEAPPPSRGDPSGRSSGVCNARTFPERKSGRGIRRFVSAYYPKHTPQSPPSRGVARSAGGCIFPGRYRHLSLSSNRKIKNQLATMTTSGVTSSYTYDPWGRLVSVCATAHMFCRDAAQKYKTAEIQHRSGFLLLEDDERPLLCGVTLCKKMSLQRAGLKKCAA